MVTSDIALSPVEKQSTYNRQLFSFSPTDDISILLDKVLAYLLSHISSVNLTFIAAVWVSDFPALMLNGSLSSWVDLDSLRIREYILFFCANHHPPIFIQIELQPSSIRRAGELPC
jgi:hypothetical protein